MITQIIMMKNQIYKFWRDINMNKIANNNAIGICVEEFCDMPYTHITKLDINGITVNLLFCKQHSLIFEAFEHCKGVVFKEPPIIKCRYSRIHDTYSFFCKYCGAVHTHGAGDGHRNAHCNSHRSLSPYRNIGYILKGNKPK
jgi:hypothetical protein